MTLKHQTALLISAAVVVLAGCGGGGSSTQPTTTDYVGKYVGTWKTACWTASIYQDTSVTPPANAYLTRTIVFKASDTSNLSASATDTVYASNDPTCSGPVQATITRTGLATGDFLTSATNKTVTSSFGVNTLAYAGTVALGSVTGDKFDVVTAPIHSSSNLNLSIGTISFKSADFLGGSVKGAYYLNGTTLTAGAGGTATAYPTSLTTSASGIFTKQ